MAQTVQKDMGVSRSPGLRLVRSGRFAPLRFEAADPASASNLRLVAGLMTAAGSRLEYRFADGYQSDGCQSLGAIAPIGRSGITCRARLVMDAGASTGCLAAGPGLSALYAAEGLKGVLPGSLPAMRVVIAAIEEDREPPDWHEAAVAAWCNRRGQPRVGVIGHGWAPVERARALASLWPEADFRPCCLAEAVTLFATDAAAFDLVLAPVAAAEVFAMLGAGLSGTRSCMARVRFAGSEEYFEDISTRTSADASQSDPSGLLLAAVWLLRRAGETSVAERLHNAWLRTLEDGLHTPAIQLVNPYARAVSAREFADELAERLGQQPRHRPAVRYDGARPRQRAALRLVR